MQMNKLNNTLILTLVTSALAQAQPELPEEIVITGSRPAFLLREELNAAQDEVYDIFNSLVDEKDFHITCQMVDREFSRILSRQCAPAFLNAAMSQDAQAYLATLRTQMMNPGELSPGNAPLPISPPAPAVVATKQKQFQAKMKDLAENNSEFQKALIRYVELKEQYSSRFSQDDSE